MRVLRILWAPLLLPLLAAIAGFVFLAWLFWPLRTHLKETD